MSLLLRARLILKSGKLSLISLLYRVRPVRNLAIPLTLRSLAVRPVLRHQVLALYKVTVSTPSRTAVGETFRHKAVEDDRPPVPSDTNFTAKGYMSATFKCEADHTPDSEDDESVGSYSPVKRTVKV